jgi:ribosomal protein S18 acetylase RimI-like enzyme
MFPLAAADDVEAIAARHARSCKENYRGIYAGAFLDNDAIANRLDAWSQPLRAPARDQVTTAGQAGGSLAGFGHVILDEDALRGAVVQNLPVRTNAQPKGIGTALLSAVAQALQQRRPASRRHVRVREDNTAAMAFYEALQGTRVDRKLGGPSADGSRAPVLCYWWANPGNLLTSVAREAGRVTITSAAGRQ